MTAPAPGFVRVAAGPGGELRALVALAAPVVAVQVGEEAPHLLA